ncbi:hypothetical protein AAFF_G00205030 [Aldrovandia affinis]|uniref:FXYD domain-containing ion transport regulator n=1 Tax=Aldrovandia affinis TaxID=143900 RepID=A0AAD7RI20_9TELE|nr:hypothetical protein AAFF_G00205030 [Aldrovandia affinis]
MLVVGGASVLFWNRCRRGNKKDDDDSIILIFFHELLAFLVRVRGSLSLMMAKIAALVLVTFLSLVYAEEKQEDDPFTFDYYRLRVGGLILAAVLCLIGITILFSGHCRCKFNQDKRRRAGSSAATQQMLNDGARASEC